MTTIEFKTTPTLANSIAGAFTHFGSRFLNHFRFKPVIFFPIMLFLLFAFVPQPEEMHSDLINKDEKKILILGCGRSGTTYTSEFLKKSGYDISHERMGRDGCVSWPMVVNYYSPWVQSNMESFEHIFQQVRHPLDVITSWYINLKNLDRDEWKFVRRHIPQIDRSDSLIVHCAKYWYYWNLLAEEKAEWRFQIEQIADILPEFAFKSGLKLSPDVVTGIPKNVNKWNKISRKLSWKDLETELPESLYINIVNMATRYGYIN